MTKLYKKIGDSVKKGEIIAEVDANSVALDIANVELSLSNARNNYDKLFTSTTESAKLRSKNTLSESQTNLALMESQYENLLISQSNTLNDNEAGLKLLESKLALAKSQLEYTKENIKTDTTSNNLEKDMANAFESLEDIGRTIPDIIKKSKEFIMIEDKSNPRYGDLSAKDITIKARVEPLYTSIVSEVDDYTSLLSTLRNKNPRNFDEILSAIESAKTLLTDMSAISALIVAEYDASIESNNLTADLIASTKTTMRGYGTTLGSKLSTLNSTLATLKGYGSDTLQSLADKNTLAAQEQSVTTAQNDFIKAQAALEALKKSQVTDRTSKSQDIENQKNAIKLNAASYQELIKGPTSTDLISARNNISQAEIALAKTKLSLSDYQIIATFDGVIDDIPWKVGDTTVGDSTTGTSNQGILVENKNAYEVDLSFDQIDIVKVAVGMPASIVLDAFPTETYTGNVASISAVPTVTSGVISYVAKVILTIPRTDIYSKMSATVEIVTTSKDNILVIPTSAITSENGKSYVNRAKDPTIFSRLATASRSWSTRSFSGGQRNRPSGSYSSGSVFDESGAESSSGRSFSGVIPYSGSSRNGWRRWSTWSLPTFSTSETVPTDKVEIVIGGSWDGKTEVLSGLQAGDVIIVAGKSTTAKSSSGAASSSTRVPGAWGFGAGRPPGL